MKQNNRKNQRTSVARPQRQRPISQEGVYSNYAFMHAATSHVGNTVSVQTQSGAVFEGIFRTFSPQFQVALEVAHRVDYPSNGEEPKIALDSLKSANTIIFKLQDIVSICTKNVDLEYATRDTFATDTAISRCNGNGRSEDRELEPWDPTGGLTNGDCDLSLELDDNSNGWDANEMFQKNETVYGVQSTFDQSLTGYTVQIEKKNTKDFKEQEAEAEKIANEIENNPIYRDRIDIENGDELDDEEAKFSAVIRTEHSSPPPPQPQRQERQDRHHQESNRQSDSIQRSEPQINHRESHSRDSRGEVREINNREPRENHIDKGVQSPPTSIQIQNQAPPTNQVIPQVSAQQDRISTQQSDRNRDLHHQQGPGSHHHGNSSHSQTMPNPTMHPGQQNMNPNINNVPSAAKFVPPPKRNMKPGGKLVRSTPPPPNASSNSGPPTPQSPQAPPQGQQNPQQNNQNNYGNPMMQSQPGVQNMNPGTQYITHTHTQVYTQHIHNQATAGKLNNGDQSGNQANNKMQQRSYNRYTNAPNTNVAAPPPNVGPQMKNMPPPTMQMGKQIQVRHLVQSHVAPPSVDGQPTAHVVVAQPHQIVIQQPIIGPGPPTVGPQQQMPPPQPQRQPRSREEQNQEFRKFHHNFKLETSSHPQDNRNNQVQNSQQNEQQQMQNQNMQNQGQNKQQRDQMQRNAGNMQQNVQTVNVNDSHQMQINTPNQTQVTPNVHAQQTPMNSNNNSNNTPSSNSSSNESTPSDKGNNSSSGKKHVLNPNAKSFIPRSPSTPNTTRLPNSRPHTPQTPSPAIQPGQIAYAPSHTPGPPMVATAAGQPPISAYVPAYVVQHTQTAFQQQPRQTKRMHTVQVQPTPAQIQVAAATGQPLLAQTPGLQFMYQAPPQPFTGTQQITFRPITYESGGQPQIQYLAPTPPSTTPSPGQAHQASFHPGPQPSPAGGAPTATYVQTTAQHQQFPVQMLPIPGTQLMSHFYQPPPGHNQPIQVLMQQQHPSAQ